MLRYDPGRSSGRGPEAPAARGNGRRARPGWGEDRLSNPYTTPPRFRLPRCDMVETGRPHDRPEKTVHVRIDPNDESTTLEDVLTRIAELQRKHPDREVFV